MLRRISAPEMRKQQLAEVFGLAPRPPTVNPNGWGRATDIDIAHTDTASHDCGRCGGLW